MELGHCFVHAYKTRLLLHLVAATHLGCAVCYDFLYARLPRLAVELRLEAPIGGKLKYLTFLCGLLQCAYYLLALVYDVLRARRLRLLRDFLLASYVVPLALTVSLTFWTLLAIGRESIYPGLLDLIYPAWLNQTLHSFVVLYALLELCLTQHRYPPRSRGLAGLALFMAAYLAWMHFIWLRTGIWVYPFLGALSATVRLLFLALIVGLSFVYYLLGERVNAVLWPRSCGLRRWSSSE
ncbi:androgen-induced gene 1 protein [Drosophila subobscura]|uniref:androgen-induced gene 1 protein n=1 Tax=Drosophila subobscura TaxID=7241 RepID=UPI00155B0C30|nr:androgen-induced gene 1 protein [Drosophila subobscura]